MSSTERKGLQRKRSMAYFIDAAIQIINEEGLSGLSIRKTAERAGYNSATLYHYFSSFEELSALACVKFVDDYVKDLPNYLKQTDRALYKYLKVWECFCTHSFQHPDVFWFLFFQHNSYLSDESFFFQLYYKIFPEHWNDETKEYEAMFSLGNLYDRERFALTKSLTKEKIVVDESTILDINEMNILIFKGMLSTMKESPNFYTQQNAVLKTLEFLRRSLLAYGIQ